LTLEEVQRFLDIWDNPGFFPKNREPYLVKDWMIDRRNYMNFGCRWITAIDLTYPVREEWYRHLEMSETDMFITQVRDMILRGEYNLPDRVRDRLPMFMESDNLVILEIINMGDNIPIRINLVTRDVRLARRIMLLPNVRRSGAMITIIPPEIYLMGRHWDIDRMYRHGVRFYADSWTITDPGACVWATCAYFQEGMAPDSFWGDLYFNIIETNVYLVDFVLPSGRTRLRNQFDYVREHIVNTEFYTPEVPHDNEEFDLH
jgi:hypothetical protein